MLKLFAKLFAGMRVDQPDMEFIARDSQLAVLRQVADAMVKDGPSGRVVEGFVCSLVGATLTVTGGRGLFTLRGIGELLEGVLVDDPNAQTVDTTGMTGIRGVWVTARLASQAERRRVFLDVLASPIAEYLRAKPTREALTWSVRVSATTPGAEWSKIGEIDFSLGPDLSDERSMLFDVDPYRTPAGVLQDVDWGLLAERQSYGLDLFTVIRALQRQVQDIIGEVAFAGPFWKSPPVRSILDLNASKLETDGALDIDGILQPDGDNTRDLGTSVRRFKEFFARTGRLGAVILGELLLGSNANAEIARIEVDYSTAGGRNRTLIFKSKRDAAVGASPVRWYRAQSSPAQTDAIEEAFNCVWNNTAGEWTADDPGVAIHAELVVRSRSEQVWYRRNDTSAAWNDGGWTRMASVDFVNGSMFSNAAGGIHQAERFSATLAAPDSTDFDLAAVYKDTTIKAMLHARVIGAGTGIAALEVYKKVNIDLDACSVDVAVDTVSIVFWNPITNPSPMPVDVTPISVNANGYEMKINGMTDAGLDLEVTLGGTGTGIVLTNHRFMLLVFGDP